MRVLLVENSDTDATLFTELVRGVAGIAVQRASKLAEALEVAKDCDIVVLDLFLPDSAAEETVEAIERFWPTPVLVCSEGDDPAWIIAAGRRGAVGYLVKGAAPSQIVNSLYCALGQALRVAAIMAEQQTMRERLLERLTGVK